MKYTRLFASFLCLSTFLFSNENVCNHPKIEYEPWFTGTILAPLSSTTEPGHPLFQLALVGINLYGKYNSHHHLVSRPSIWSFGPYGGIQIGLTKTLGIDVIGGVYSNFCHGASYTHPIDTIFRVGFQVSRDQKDSWVPDFRILLQEIFPSGHYQHFSPAKNGTDSTGYGSYQTGIHFAFQKHFHRSVHPFRFGGSLGYIVPAFVHVEGINVYGGTKETIGRVRLGNYITAYFVFEYRLCHSWAMGLEGNFRQGVKGHSIIKRGGRVDALPIYELSLAPLLEHTYSGRLASRFGGWVSLTGKNSPAFATLFTSIQYKF